MKEAIILVHGIWSNGLDLWRLRQRLKQAGYECHAFNYHVWGKPLEVTAQKLKAFTDTLDAPVIHFIGHSLGGIVLLHYFEQFPYNHRGRVVLMGSPVNGSRVAQRLSKTFLTRWIVGNSLERGLNGDAPCWKGWQDIGIIAGSFPFGFGMLVGGLEMPHDGTVSVSETQLGGASDYIILPVSHTGMLMSSEVAIQTVIFLRTGKFDEDTTTVICNSTSA